MKTKIVHTFLKSSVGFFIGLFHLESLARSLQRHIHTLASTQSILDNWDFAAKDFTASFLMHKGIKLDTFIRTAVMLLTSHFEAGKHTHKGDVSLWCCVMCEAQDC